MVFRIVKRTEEPGGEFGGKQDMRQILLQFGTSDGVYDC